MSYLELLAIKLVTYIGMRMCSDSSVLKCISISLPVTDFKETPVVCVRVINCQDVFNCDLVG